MITLLRDMVGRVRWWNFHISFCHWGSSQSILHIHSGCKIFCPAWHTLEKAGLYEVVWPSQFNQLVHDELLKAFSMSGVPTPIASTSFASPAFRLSGKPMACFSQILTNSWNCAKWHYIKEKLILTWSKI